MLNAPDTESRTRRPVVTLGDLVYALYPSLPLPALRVLAGLQGRWMAVKERRAWRAVRDNLAACATRVPLPASAELLTRRFFAYRQLRRAFVVLGPKLGGVTLDRLFPLVGLEHLEAALAERRGVVLLGSHMNSMCGFIARYQLERRGFDARVAMPVDEPPFRESRVRQRLDRWAGRPPNPMFAARLSTRFNVRPLMRALELNAVVLMMGDGWHSSGLVEVELLGRQVFLTSGPVGAARVAGSPVVPVFCDGIPGEPMSLCLEAPLPVPAGVGMQEQVRIMVRDFAQRLEKRIQENPACWEHWQEPGALDQMGRLADRSLAERYLTG